MRTLYILIFKYSVIVQSVVCDNFHFMFSDYTADHACRLPSDQVHYK
jgi:hypothetical protein